MNKDIALTYLKELNKGQDTDRVITRLYYNDNGDFVEDYSSFANEKYMSNELLSALQNGQTLPSHLQNELSTFVIEAKI